MMIDRQYVDVINLIYYEFICEHTLTLCSIDFRVFERMHVNSEEDVHNVLDHAKHKEEVCCTYLYLLPFSF